MKGHVLLVEDDDSLRASIADYLAADHRVSLACSCGEAEQVFAEVDPDVVVLDIQLPDGSGLGLMERLVGRGRPVIIMTAFPEVQTAVHAVRLGAYDYLNKPFDLDHLKLVVGRALEHRRLHAELDRLRRAAPRIRGLEDFLGDSEGAREVRRRIRQLGGAGDTTVLVTGPTGAGKELVAEALHMASAFAEGPFVRVNCAALPDSLFEAELFGHDRGAFTGAVARRGGLVALAEGGTLLLDEVGEIPLPMQSKMLRFVDTRAYRPIGGGVEHTARVRVIAATNRDLGAEVRAGRFREDLFFRLAVLQIEVPPLCARAEDIPILAERLLADIGASLGRTFGGLGEQLLRELRGYRWPGNVRELRNVLERAAVLAPGPEITCLDRPVRPTIPPAGTATEVPTLAEVERRHVLAVYELCERNKTRAAEALGMTRGALRERLRQYLLDP